MTIKRVYSLLFIWRVLLVDLIVALYEKDKRQLLWKDLGRIGNSGVPFVKNNYMKLNYVLLTQKQFRSIFYYRYKKCIFSHLCKLFLPSTHEIEIRCIKDEIGGGFLLYHKMGRVIDLHSCGENFTVSQGVTVGLGHSNSEGRNSPIIGNNVSIATNSVVFGPITIGDNSIIGAGSVVTKDVPANATVVGNPARIIRLNGERVDIAL